MGLASHRPEVAEVDRIDFAQADSTRSSVALRIELAATGRDFRDAVIERANRETAEFIGQPKHFLRRAIYVSLASVLTYLSAVRWEQAAQAATGALIAAIAGNFVIVAVVWLWHGLRAPCLIYSDDRQALSKARDTIKVLRS